VRIPLRDMPSSTSVMDAATVLVGMRPAVAITLVELGMSLKGIRTALNVDKGMLLLRESLGPADEDASPEGEEASTP
ncbi:MAG: anti-anti-sigma factor, partial [Myxococcales bacterium]